VARARRELAAEGAPPGRVRIECSLDVRYVGQSYELPLPMAAGFRRAFHRAHRDRYGYADETRPIEVVNLRVSATAPLPWRPAAVRQRAPARDPAAVDIQPHRIRWAGRWLAARCCDRAAL